MTPDIQTKLAAMVERIVAGFKPERIILFGSNARGTAGSDSDVDLIIVLPTIESKRRIRLAIHEAEKLTDYAVSARYPDDVEFLSLSEATQASEIAKRVSSAVRAYLPREARI